MLTVSVNHRNSGTTFDLHAGEITVKEQKFGATLEMSKGEEVSATCYLHHKQVESLRDQLNELLDPPDQTIPHPTTAELAESSPLVEDSSGA